jgi:hypothetical protein
VSAVEHPVVTVREAEAKVTGAAAALADLYTAVIECDQAGGDVQRAFAAGLPPGFVSGLISQEPMLGAIFMALGVPVE